MYTLCLIVCCIVLYCIYIALLAVHTNQKCFECKRSREMRAVLREWKEALGWPVNKVDRVERESWFQSAGPMIAKACVWAIEVLACGTKRSWPLSEHSRWRQMTKEGKRIRSCKYLGAWPICKRYIIVRTLSWIRAMSGSMKAEMWDVWGTRAISVAAAYRTDWTGERRTFGRPTRNVLQ